MQRSSEGLFVVIRSRRERMQHLADLNKGTAAAAAARWLLRDVGCTLSAEQCSVCAEHARRMHVSAVGHVPTITCDSQ